MPGSGLTTMRAHGRAAGSSGTAAARACVGAHAGIEFLDRRVALSGEAFVSFFRLVIAVAAFVSERLRASIIAARVMP